MELQTQPITTPGYTGRDLDAYATVKAIEALKLQIMKLGEQVETTAWDIEHGKPGRSFKKDFARELAASIEQLDEAIGTVSKYHGEQ